MYKGSLAVEPGRYLLEAKAGVCKSYFDVTILEGRDRHVGVVVRTGRVIYQYDAKSYVAGRLPMAGIDSGALVAPDGTQYALDIDNEAYYAEHLRNGNYVLTLHFAQTDIESRIPIRIPGSGIVRDVSGSDISDTVGIPVHYHGGSDVFMRLWNLPQQIQ